MHFDIISEITVIETIAVGSQIRESSGFGSNMGRRGGGSLKGIARIRLSSGRVRVAELHWYEAHGIGKKEIKRKRYLD